MSNLSHWNKRRNLPCIKSIGMMLYSQTIPMGICLSSIFRYYFINRSNIQRYKMCIPLAPWMCIPDSLNHKFRMFSSPELDTFLSGTPSRIFALMRSQSTRIHSYHISLSYHLPRITRQARYVTHSTLNSLFLQERNMLNRLCHKVCIHAFQSSCNGEDCSLARTISLSGLKHSLLHILSMRSSRRLNNSYWRIVST